MEKPFHYKRLTRVEQLVAVSASLVICQPQIAWLRQYVHPVILFGLYGALWTFVPLTIHIHSWKKISFSKPW